MHLSDLSLSVSEISWTVAQANRGVKTVFSLETGETETNYSVSPSRIYTYRWQIIGNDGVYESNVRCK